MIDRQTIDAMLDAIHAGLVGAGVPAADRFQRVIELPAKSFRFDARYPDLTVPRNERFVLIEILWSVGRSVKIKRPLAGTIASAVAAAAGIDPEQVMIVFVETLPEGDQSRSGSVETESREDGPARSGRCRGDHRPGV